MSEARFIVGDVFAEMANIPDGSIDLIVTSPPFLALRSYLPDDHPDKGKEIGSEATPADFLSTLLALTREWRRILAPHGSLCVELGDTYSRSGGAGGDYNPGGLRYGQPQYKSKFNALTGKRPVIANDPDNWPLPKSLCLLPTLYPASLAYGRNLLTGEPCEPWRIRNQIVWHRPNPPVGGLGDKVRPSTSYITVACTSRTRWFDLDAERTTPGPIGGSTTPGIRKDTGSRVDDGLPHYTNNHPAGAPPLDCWFDTTTDDVWTLPTAPYKGSHYATFPPALPRKLINLMCPRQVCRECGEPRRRIVGEEPHRTAQDELAKHIEQQRKAAGYERRELACLFPHYKNTESILAQFSNWERGKNVPAPADWEILQPVLQLSDMFDPYIYGDRQWTESLVEYVANGQRLAPDERDTTGYRRGGFGSIPGGVAVAASRIAPDEWSDCGHNTWRRGLVLDPFCGSGTTLVAASELGRDSIGIDIDSRNLDLARQRCGMFLVEEEVAL